MAQIDLVTGYTGEAHVTSDDDALLNRYFVGKNNAIINNTYVSRGTELGVNCDVLIGGHLARTNGTVYLPFNIPSSGYYRIDGVYVTYQKDGNGVESSELLYIEGTESGTSAAAVQGIGTPTQPSGLATFDYVLVYIVSWNNSQGKTIVSNKKVDTVTLTISIDSSEEHSVEAIRVRTPGAATIIYFKFNNSNLFTENSIRTITVSNPYPAPSKIVSGSVSSYFYSYNDSYARVNRFFNYSVEVSSSRYFTIDVKPNVSGTIYYEINGYLVVEE